MGVISRIRNASDPAFDERYYTSSVADILRTSGPGDSGEWIDEHSAFGVGDYFKCARVLMEDVAKTPFKLYERVEIGGDMGANEARNHSLFPILHDEPNDYMESFTLIETIMGHLLSWGNAYCYIERYPGTGKIAALWPLCPNYVRVVTNEKGPNGEVLDPVYYVRSQSSTVEARFEYKEILHFRSFSFDGIKGLSLVRLMMDQLGWSKATARFGARFFKNSSQAGGFLAHPGKLGVDGRKRLAEAIHDRVGGVNQHKLLILEEGLKFEKMSIAPNEAQFLETIKYQRTDIGGLMRVVLHKIGDYEKATFSNIEHLNIEHVTDGLVPWFCRIQQTVNRRLLTAQEKKRYFAEFQVDALMRGDMASQTAHCKEMFAMACYSPNQILKFFNKNPYEGGNKRYIQLNMIPVDKLDDYYKEETDDESSKERTESEPEPTTSPRRFAENLVRNAVKKAYSKVFRNEIGRALNRKSADRAKVVAGSMITLLSGLAEGLGLELQREVIETVDGKEVPKTVDTEHVAFIADYVQAMSKRAVDWKPEDVDSISTTELHRAASALIERSRP